MRYHKIFWLIPLLIGCLERYEPPVIKENPELLVVDAFISLNTASASVDLSRSALLGSGEPPKLETGASVTIEDDNGAAYQLVENSAGSYSFSGINLDTKLKYRLHIRTFNEKEYLSDFITLKNTPPIDDLSWAVTENGVEIYLDTHDPAGNSHYFKWNYFETWEYNATYEANLKLVNGIFIPLKPEEKVYTCWRTIPAATVLVATTNRLQSDVVNDFNVCFVPRGSVKISIKYSILVQQQTLSEDGYNYWLNLQKTTENLGSLFDPQPSQIIGNIYSVSDSHEPVIGYFDGGFVSEKRIFIAADELPSRLTNYSRDCSLDSVFYPVPGVPSGNASFVVTPFSDIVPEKNGYLISTRNCVDCTTLGGQTIKPDFWE